MSPKRAETKNPSFRNRRRTKNCFVCACPINKKRFTTGEAEFVTGPYGEPVAVCQKHSVVSM